jgi:cytochrome d ubiquinol oxidase subunit I
MTGAFAIASVAAYKLLRKKRSPREMAYHRKALFLTLIIGGSMSVLTAVNGHATAQMLHRYQPEKLAGAEGLFETRSYAPLTIGGFTSEVEQGVKYGIEIPWALSFLAGNHFDTVVKGLNEFPRENWPPLYIHTLFNLMVGIGSLLIVLAFVALALKLWWKKHYPRWILWLLLLSGPMSMVGIETGWIFSCTGRQPWTIYHIQRTSEAAIQSNSLLTLFIMFISLYVFLMFVTIFVLRFYFGRNPVAKELT